MGAWISYGPTLARIGETANVRRCFERALRYDPGCTAAAENLKTVSFGGPPLPR